MESALPYPVHTCLPAVCSLFHENEAIPVIFRPRQRSGTVFLTIDDGPSSWLTERILDLLQAYRMQASFFLLGSGAAAHPGLVSEIVSEGHEVFSHGYDHVTFASLSDGEIQDHLSRAEDVLSKFRSFPEPYFLRAPGGYGRNDRRIQAAIKRWCDHAVFVHWTTETGDTAFRHKIQRVEDQVRTGTAITNKILQAAKQESLTILAHDFLHTEPGKIIGETNTLVFFRCLLEGLRDGGVRTLKIADEFKDMASALSSHMEDDDRNAIINLVNRYRISQVKALAGLSQKLDDSPDAFRSLRRDPFYERYFSLPRNEAWAQRTVDGVLKSYSHGAGLWKTLGCFDERTGAETIALQGVSALSPLSIRHGWIASRLDAMLPRHRPVRILDVGGVGEGAVAFLAVRPDAHYTVVTDQQAFGTVASVTRQTGANIHTRSYYDRIDATGYDAVVSHYHLSQLPFWLQNETLRSVVSRIPTGLVFWSGAAASTPGGGRMPDDALRIVREAGQTADRIPEALTPWEERCAFACLSWTSPQKAAPTVRTSAGPKIMTVSERNLSSLESDFSLGKFPLKHVQQLARTPWIDHRYPYAHCLVHNGEVVGWILSIYARRNLLGADRTVCNLSTWLVEPSHRNASMLLFMAALRDARDFPITAHTPSNLAVKLYHGLKFQVVDSERFMLPMETAGLEAPAGRTLEAIGDPARIRDYLDDTARRLLDDHAGLPVHHLMIRDGERFCYFMYAVRPKESAAFADMLNHPVGTPGLLSGPWRLDPDCAAASCRNLVVDRRFLERDPPGAGAAVVTSRPRFFKGPPDMARHIDFLYSEAPLFRASIG